MKKKLKDYDDVLYCCRKDYVKYDRVATKKYSGSHLSLTKNLRKCWDDPGSTRSGWNFFHNWFDSKVGLDAQVVRRQFATCKKWNKHWRINQKWNRFVDDRYLGRLALGDYYINDQGIFCKYD